METRTQLAKVSSLIDTVHKLSDEEYERTLQIYNKPEHFQEYKKLIYTGLIQFFSILALKELKNVIHSIEMRKISLSMKESGNPLINIFFQPFFFEKNTYFQLNSVWNKIATLIKIRFLKPDDRFGAEISRVVGLAKKSSEYTNHRVKTFIDQLRGSKDNDLFLQLRKESEHGLEPEYLYKMNNRFEDINFNKCIELFIQIIETLYNEHLTYIPTISDNDVEKLKRKDITPFNLTPLEIKKYIKSNQSQIKSLYKLTNTTLNYFDYFEPWVMGNEIFKDYQFIRVPVVILHDIAFRYNDTIRAFQYFAALYTGNLNRFPDEIANVIKDIDYSYFMNIACIRVYSIWDKIGLYFTKIFSMPKDKTFFKNAAEWIINNSGSDYKKLRNILKKTIDSDEFKALDMIRQQYVHGIDLSMKQYEGVVLSDDYIFVTLHYNLENTLGMVEYLHNDFMPSELRKLFYSIFSGYPEGYLEILNKIRYTRNPYLQPEEYYDQLSEMLLNE